MKLPNIKKLSVMAAIAVITFSASTASFAQAAPASAKRASSTITAPEKPEGTVENPVLAAPAISSDNKLFKEKQPNDLTIGEASAPVKIVEYASLSCIHCKHFHDEVFYEIKKRFVDTGKVQFTYRHFPLNSAATKAAMIVNCAPESEKLAFTSAFFKSQAQWAFVENDSELKDKLKTIARIGGMDDAKFEQCFTDQPKEDAIIAQMRQAYEELKVETTPSIFIDGIRFDGARTIESFAEVINDKLQKKSK